MRKFRGHLKEWKSGGKDSLTLARFVDHSQHFRVSMNILIQTITSQPQD